MCPNSSGKGMYCAICSNFNQCVAPLIARAIVRAVAFAKLNRWPERPPLMVISYSSNTPTSDNNTVVALFQEPPLVEEDALTPMDATIFTGYSVQDAVRQSKQEFSGIPGDITVASISDGVLESFQECPLVQESGMDENLDFHATFGAHPYTEEQLVRDIQMLQIEQCLPRTGRILPMHLDSMRN